MSDTTQHAGVTRWRMKPVIVEAWQLTDDDDCDWEAISEWCSGLIYNVAIAPGAEPETRIGITSHAGTFTAYEGDWIVRGPDGCIVLPAGKFARVYEPEPTDSADDVVTVSRADLRDVLDGMSSLRDEGSPPMSDDRSAVMRAARARLAAAAGVTSGE